MGDGVGIDPGRGTEDGPIRGGGVEHAVDDDAVEVVVGIEGRTEAVNERGRAAAGREARARAVRTQVLLHHPQEHPPGSALQIGIAVQEVAQALGHRQHPLPHRQALR